MRPTDELPVILADQVRSLNYDGPDGGETFADAGTLLDLSTGSLTSTGLVVDGVTGDVTVRGDLTGTAFVLVDPDDVLALELGVETVLSTDDGRALDLFDYSGDSVWRMEWYSGAGSNYFRIRALDPEGASPETEIALNWDKDMAGNTSAGEVTLSSNDTTAIVGNGGITLSAVGGAGTTNVQIGATASGEVRLAPSGEPVKVGQTSFSQYGVIEVAGPADGGLALRRWSAGFDYNSIATVNMTGSEYVILTDGTDSFLSAGSGGAVTIRAGANDQREQIEVDPSGTTLRSDAIAAALDGDGTDMGVIGGLHRYRSSTTNNNAVTTGGATPTGVRVYADARRPGAVAIVTGTADFNSSSTGWGAGIMELLVNGSAEADQGVVTEAAIGTGRGTCSKVWVVALPTDATTELRLRFSKVVGGGSLQVNSTHTVIAAAVFG